jgi:asparagine synthase (glutamine-hydrolysing)
LPAGHFLHWEDGRTKIQKWYDLAAQTGEAYDERQEIEVAEEYLALLKDAVRLRFRADVPVGINLSGGVDSATLLGLVHAIEKEESAVAAYTFTTGDDRYDELPWVRRMIAKTAHRHLVCQLSAAEVPALAADVQRYQDEPFGGIPTLAYAKIFEQARRDGTIVLLDGNGLDEQWAGYDYYAETVSEPAEIVQGSRDKPTRPECLSADFRALAGADEILTKVFPDRLRNLQYRDAMRTKLPRALRYNDRISMRASTELREPFLDHRLFELALRQPPMRKIFGGTHKKMLREIVRKILPEEIVTAPKRALQTPQREWLRGALREWANEQIETALNGPAGAWFDRESVRREWENFCLGRSDNSFYVWQWISLGLISLKKIETNKGGSYFASRKCNFGAQSRQALQTR